MPYAVEAKLGGELEGEDKIVCDLRVMRGTSDILLCPILYENVGFQAIL